MIYNPENIRLREVDSRSGRRFKMFLRGFPASCGAGRNHRLA